MKKLTDDLKTLIKNLPKAELHIHLDGSVLPETLYEFNKDYSLSGLRNKMRVPKNCRSLNDYLATFQLVLPLLQSTDILEKISYDVVAQADKDNIKYIEVRFSPGLHLHHGLTVSKVIESVLTGLAAGGKEFGIKTGLIICAIREKDPDFSTFLFEQAAEYKNSGVVGVDLAGDEVHYESLLHIKAFQTAFSLGLNITVHAGEARGADSIKQALTKLKADRIGHGIRLFEDPELLETVKIKQIPLEVCPTSNLQTKTVSSYAAHPARNYFRDGLLVTINTDNRTASNVTLNREYENIAENWNLGKQDLIRIAKNGFKAGFLTDAEKNDFLSTLFKEEKMRYS